MMGAMNIETLLDSPDFGHGIARRGLYIDVEGSKGLPPTLLGVYREEGEGAHFVQHIFEDGFAPLVVRPVEGLLANVVAMGALEDTLRAIATEAEADGRALFAWGADVRSVLAQSTDDADLLGWYGAHLLDAKDIAKRWKRKAHPDLVWNKTHPHDPVHTLERYQGLVGYPMEPGERRGHTGKRLAKLRAKLDGEQGVSRSLNAAWTKVLNHNFHDCCGMRAVVLAGLSGLG
jgi:hypothetical protein